MTKKHGHTAFHVEGCNLKPSSQYSVSLKWNVNLIWGVAESIKQIHSYRTHSCRRMQRHVRSLFTAKKQNLSCKVFFCAVAKVKCTSSCRALHIVNLQHVWISLGVIIQSYQVYLPQFQAFVMSSPLKPLDPFGKQYCPRPTLCLPQLLYQITNLWKFRLNGSSVSGENNGKPHPCFRAFRRVMTCV